MTCNNSSMQHAAPVLQVVPIAPMLPSRYATKHSAKKQLAPSCNSTSQHIRHHIRHLVRLPQPPPQAGLSRSMTDDHDRRATTNSNSSTQHRRCKWCQLHLCCFQDFSVLLACLKATNSENQPGTRRAAERQPATASDSQQQPATAGYAVIVRQP